MKIKLLLLLSLTCSFLYAQRELSGAAELKIALEKTQVLGRVLMIAAHPDDENTAALAYFARGKKLQTGYLSLTRGEGGQNLIGSEQGDLLGVIRTQELLAARRIDGAEQFFSRAIDFGFSKTADETIGKWGRQNVLSDIVWVIRKFRPDVIVFRFSGTPRDGHGHHQSSAILGKIAFEAAADPAQFPEQLKLGVQPWKAKRAVFNSFSFTPQMEAEAAKQPGRIGVDTGTFDPVLGRSYGEIAGASRSQHRSQAMGAPERRGTQRDWFFVVAGEPAEKDIFEGIDFSWNRVGAEDVGAILRNASKGLNIEDPSATIPMLIQARKRVAEMKNEWAAVKLQEIDEAIAMCSGLYAELTAERFQAIPGGSLRLTLSVINRSNHTVASFEKAVIEGGGEGLANSTAQELPFNVAVQREFPVAIPKTQPYTSRYWLANAKQGTLYGVRDQNLIGLADNPALFRARITAKINGQQVELVRPVFHRYVDRMYGELSRPVIVVPAVAVALPEPSFIAADSLPRTVEVSLKANAPQQSGSVKLTVPAGWKVEPQTQNFSLGDAGEERSAKFLVTPPAAESVGELRAIATVNGTEISNGVLTINYPHIPPQTLFPEAVAKVVRADIKTTVKRIGYIMGAGDEVPAVLKQLGMDVTMLSSEDIARGDLSRYDTIVTGVRAYNQRADLRANQSRLLDFMDKGGTLVVQYNVQEGGFMGGNPKLLEKMGPYPITLSRDRVTVEDAPVTYPDPNHPLLKRPNVITAKDWDGWVQERGLYFATEWDPRYQTPFESHDPGEKPLPGGTLVTRYGKGAYVFTGYSWFRQLPAGVPGGIRIFTNLLNAAEAYRANSARRN
ncbi:GlcNAc-PI de-N-acetylase [Bryobacterales bacterium F-183]|nr:GlcNAc-PI de-N-acetylase [Bryobacterales bacterium F-183]